VVAYDVIVVTVQRHVVLLHICKKLVCPQYLSNLYELIVVIFTLEKWFLLENHTGKHAAQRPNVKRVVVNLEIN